MKVQRVKTTWTILVQEKTFFFNILTYTKKKKRKTIKLFISIKGFNTNYSQIRWMKLGRRGSRVPKTLAEFLLYFDIEFNQHLKMIVLNNLLFQCTINISFCSKIGSRSLDRGPLMFSLMYRVSFTYFFRKAALGSGLEPAGNL